VKFESSHAVMDDGTKYYVHARILGINDELEVTYGYDGAVHFEGYGFDDEPPIHTQHRREMADYMIALWTKFRNQP
jgi:hypothetical protein